MCRPRTLTAGVVVVVSSSMAATLRALPGSVIGARFQPRSTPGLRHGSTRAPMPRSLARPIVAAVRRPLRWMLPFLAVVLTVMIVTSALSQDPRPALHGRGLIVLAVLVAFVLLLAYGVVFRS